MKVLMAQELGDRKISVVELPEDGSRLYLENGRPYTHVDAQGENLLPYVTAMDRALKNPVNLLLLGTAGGALATRLVNRGVRVTAVDNVEIAFDVARRWFGMPDEVECVHADAVEFLRFTTRRWDTIAIDVFFNGLDIPQTLLSLEVGHLLAKVTAPGGLIVWNIADSPMSWSVHKVSRTLRHGGFSPKPLPSAVDTGSTLMVCRAEQA